jgi:DNA-binding response OmpR family regulator
MSRVLLIDDDHKLGQLLVDYFQQFNLQLDTATTPSEGFTRLEQPLPDLLVLDIMLPEMDGFEVCRAIRKRPQRFGQLPIIMLTARGDVTDRIVGLELGADDYLAKPFEPRELVARIQNVLRRSADSSSSKIIAQHSGRAQPNHLLNAKGLQMDTSKRTSLLDGQALELTTMEYELLRIFMQSPGKTFDRDELMNELRGINAELFSRAVDTLVSRLRHKLQDTNKSARFIKTVWGRGYTFVGEAL